MKIKKPINILAAIVLCFLCAICADGKTVHAAEHADIRSYVEQDGSLYGITENQEAVLLEWESPEEFGSYEMKIPEEVNGCPVTVIASGAVIDNNIKTITLPSGLRVIEDEAFINCETLSQVNFPESITYIGSHNFFAFEVLTPWYAGMISESEEDMFIVNENLLFCWADGDTVTIPEGVTSICGGAFYHEYKKVILPQSLKELHDLPEGLEEMEVPEGVTDITTDLSAEDAPWLQAQSEQADNGMVIINDILIYAAEAEGEVTIPEGVWKVSSAFEYNDKITKVILPDSVVEIRKEAFKFCDNLAEVVLGRNVRTIGEGAFEWCYDLKNITLPEGIREIPEECFIGCHNMEEVMIPDSVEAIGDYAFEYCESLKEVIIPDSVMYIGTGAFRECTNLSHVKMGQGVQSAGHDIFGNRTEDEYGTDEERITEEVIVELPDTFPDIRGEEDISHMFGLFQLRTNVVFIVNAGSSMAEVLRTHQIQENIVRYQYRYYGTDTNVEPGSVESHAAMTVDTAQLEEELQSLDRESLYEKVTEMLLFDESLYGITEEKEAVLLKWGRHITEQAIEDEGRYTDTITDKTRIVIPEEVNGYKVTGIAHGAVKEEFVKEVILPSGIHVLEETAIAGCLYLRNVELPDTIEIIGNRNFCDDGYPSEWLRDMAESSENGMFIVNGHLLYCSRKEETIVVPDGVKVVHESAFWNSDAEEVVLPEGVKAVYSFPYRMKRIRIPDSVVDIGESTIRYTPWLKDQYYWSDDGMVIIHGILVAVRDEQEEVVVPDGVWKIGSAFRNNEKLTKVTIPDSVIEIGDCAFEDCINLKEVAMSDNVRRIGDESFSDCDSLTGIKLPKEVQLIEEAAFAGCDSLSDIEWNDKLVSMREAAFFGCPIETLEIPASVKNIAEAVFIDCNALRKVSVTNDMIFIEARAFGQDEGNIVKEEVWVELPDNPIVLFDGIEIFTGYGILEKRREVVFVVNKGSSAAETVRKYQIQNGVKRYNYAYYGGDKISVAESSSNVTPDNSLKMTRETLQEELKKLHIEPVAGRITSYVIQDNSVYGLTDRGEAALIHWGTSEVFSERKTIVIPDTAAGYPVTVIAGGAIDDGVVEEIVLPESLRVIEDGAFTDCDNLCEMDIPAGVERIGNDNFGIWSRSDLNPWCIQRLQESENKMLIVNGHLLFCASDDETVTVPEGVRVIAEDAFYECPAIQVILPEGLQAIYSLPEDLEYMEVPDSVIDIGRQALHYSPWMKEKIVYSKDHTAIVNGILIGIEGKKEFVVPRGVWKVAGIMFSEDVAERVVLSDDVLEIGEGAFSYCYNLQKVVIGKNVSRIGASAFAHSALQSIILPKGIQTIGENCFRGCTKLEEVVIPGGVTLIEESAFRNCTALTKADLTASVKAVGSYAFENCGKLQSVTFSDHMRYIGNSAFSRCGSLESITIPGSVYYIGSGAFVNCVGLRHIKLEEGALYIGDKVFDNYIIEWNFDYEEGVEAPVMLEEVVIELPYRLPEYIGLANWEFFDTFTYLQKRMNIVFVVLKDSETDKAVQQYVKDNGISGCRFEYTYIPPLQLRPQESVAGGLYDLSTPLLQRKTNDEILQLGQISRYYRD